MAFLDYFKKTPKATFNNDISFEELLKKASGDPTYRATFYKRLLTEDLVIITQDDDNTEGEMTLAAETKVNIVSYEDGTIPVFTSTARIFDQNIIQKQVRFMAMKGASLLELTKGATLVLNPYSDYGKELLPQEISGLLDGSMFSEYQKKITVEKDTEVIIGQPAKYPQNMMDAFSKILSIHIEVNAAYLGWIHDPASDIEPHYIIAIDATKDIHDLFNELGSTAKAFLQKTDIVDLIKIDPNGEGISHYFLESTTPFYVKKVS